jgi:hypothetical protein
VRPATDAAFIAGFVAAEGCFTSVRGRKDHIFRIGLGASDVVLLEEIKGFFGSGHISGHERRKAHYDDEVNFAVRKLSDLVHVIVPFMDEHLPPSHKREQYLAWRAELLDYWEHRAKRVRLCTIDGCDRPRRAKGVCRHHLYVLYRQ